MRSTTAVPAPKTLLPTATAKTTSASSADSSRTAGNSVDGTIHSAQRTTMVKMLTTSSAGSMMRCSATARTPASRRNVIRTSRTNRPVRPYGRMAGTTNTMATSNSSSSDMPLLRIRAKRRGDMESANCNLPASQHLLPKMGERAAQWSTGDFHQPVERTVHLLDQKDRAGDRQRADEQDRHNGRVLGAEQTETGEDDGEPEN